MPFSNRDTFGSRMLEKPPKRESGMSITRPSLLLGKMDGLSLVVCYAALGKMEMTKH